MINIVLVLETMCYFLYRGRDKELAVHVWNKVQWFPDVKYIIL